MIPIMHVRRKNGGLYLARLALLAIFISGFGLGLHMMVGGNVGMEKGREGLWKK